MSDRQGVEIDYCPQCRGVWLDRGELDKIIERSGAPEVPPQPQAPVGVQRAPDPHGDRPAFYGDDDGHRRQSHGRGHSQPRRRSFFEDLFD